jgi:rhomboid protease GluP
VTDAISHAVVFTGPMALCKEYSLVLLARDVEHQILPAGAYWSLCVPPEELRSAYEELGRYSLERQDKRRISAYVEPLPGAAYGVVLYTVALLFVAYCAGIGIFHVDWADLGALNSSPAARWQLWRPLTALTLHSGPGHLIGNLAFGSLAGIAASRMIGTGVAWLTALIAAVLANGLEMIISPAWHRAIGASTLVFALLGVISGLAFADNQKSRERSLRRFGPMAAGLTLLALMGGGGADLSQGGPPTDVDVLGHLLGFVFGAFCGWCVPIGKLDRLPLSRQRLCGAVAVALVTAAWVAALFSAGGR